MWQLNKYIIRFLLLFVVIMPCMFCTPKKVIFRTLFLEYYRKQLITILFIIKTVLNSFIKSCSLCLTSYLDVYAHFVFTATNISHQLITHFTDKRFFSELCIKNLWNMKIFYRKLFKSLVFYFGINYGSLYQMFSTL
jgi:hypothetical protein